MLGLLTGVGTARAASSVMALGLDPRFDLTHAYFLVAGIGGMDPAAGSLASAVWNDWVVDGDIGYEIDAREIPHATEAERKLWTTGYVPLRKSVPYEQPLDLGETPVYQLNPALVEWAFETTKDVALPDSPELKALRMEFAGDAAHRPPMVMKGANLSASTFWHGELMNTWAENWVKYATAGRGTYAICGMEDTGTLQSLTWLARAGRVDIHRVMVLRTASNYDVPKIGVSAAESIAQTKIGHYTAFVPSLETAYRVGHVVVDSIVANWSADTGADTGEHEVSGAVCGGLEQFARDAAHPLRGDAEDDVRGEFGGAGRRSSIAGAGDDTDCRHCTLLDERAQRHAEGGALACGGGGNELGDRAGRLRRRARRDSSGWSWARRRALRRGRGRDWWRVRQPARPVRALCASETGRHAQRRSWRWHRRVRR